MTDHEFIIIAAISYFGLVIGGGLILCIFNVILDIAQDINNGK